MKKIIYGMILMVLPFIFIDNVGAETVRTCKYAVNFNNILASAKSQNVNFDIKVDTESEATITSFDSVVDAGDTGGIYITKQSKFLEKYNEAAKSSNNCPDITFYFDSSVSAIQLQMADVSIPDGEKSVKLVGTGEAVTPTDTPTDTTVTDGSTISCGEITDIPEALPILTSNLITLIKLFVPIILIIMGMLDFGKAMAANDDKAAAESRKKFIRRVIASVIIFLTVTIVQFALGVFGTLDNTTLAGMNLFINGDCVAQRTCYNYSSDKCPSTAENGSSCGVAYNGSQLSCVKLKGCSEYAYAQCPEKSDSGDACKVEYNGSQLSCMKK